MVVTEKIAALIGRKNEEDRRRQADKEKYQIQYDRGILEALRKQAGLLEEFRKSEVGGMVEQITGEPILPIMDPYLGIIPDISEDEWKRMEDVERNFASRVTNDIQRIWFHRVYSPRMNESGNFDNILRIEVVERHRGKISTSVIDVGSVLVEYGVNRSLKISGKEVTFEGSISDSHKLGEVDSIEDALASAIVNPKPISSSP